MLLIAMILVTLLLSVPMAIAGGAFDEFGYNYAARIFVGRADGVDRVLDGAVWGDPTYANDHLVMKWSKGWDDARFHGVPWGPDAWEDNEWNGMVWFPAVVVRFATIRLSGSVVHAERMVTLCQMAGTVSGGNLK